jgi:hypothetical protein
MIRSRQRDPVTRHGIGYVTRHSVDLDPRARDCAMPYLLILPPRLTRLLTLCQLSRPEFGDTRARRG